MTEQELKEQAREVLDRLSENVLAIIAEEQSPEYHAHMQYLRRWAWSEEGEDIGEGPPGVNVAALARSVVGEHARNIAERRTP